MNDEKNKIYSTAQDRNQRLAVGSKIKELRTTARLAQTELAAKAGIAVGTLRKLERGQYIRRFKTVAHSCFNAIRAFMFSNCMVLDPPNKH